MYRYAATDPRSERGRYFYAPFEGPAFIDAYRASRQLAIDAFTARAGGGPRPAGAVPVASEALPEPRTGVVSTRDVLAAMDGPGHDGRRVTAWLAVLVRKIEVARVLRAGYGPDLRPTGDAEAHPDAYALLARLLARRAGIDPAGGDGPDLGLLSSLLKTGDILAWLAGREDPGLTASGSAAAAEALELERSLVASVVRSGIPSPDGPVAPLRWVAAEGTDADAWSGVDRPAASDAPPVANPAASAAPPAQTPGRLVLLAADTARARAYLHLLREAGLAPDEAILVESSDPGAGSATRPFTTLFDNGTPLADALARAGVPCTRLRIERLDDAHVTGAVRRAAAELVVVAGPPGVLLGPAFFGPGAPRYLHVHPGRLPAYRGSTPMYYELLREGRLTATALLLDEGIDTGQVLAERGFEPPADLATIDGAFDPWMRAVLLRDVLAARAAGWRLAGLPQPGDEGRAFHVIHPVLRHAALLARPGRAR